MPATFDGTLVKWGSSVGIAIPKPIRDGLNLQPGDKVKITARDDNTFCIEKVQ